MLQFLSPPYNRENQREFEYYVNNRKPFSETIYAKAKQPHVLHTES